MNIGIDVRALSSKRLTGIGNYIYNCLKYIAEHDKINQYYLLSSGLKNKTHDLLNFDQANIHYVHIKQANKFINFKFFLNIGKDLSKFFPVKLDLFWLPNMIFYKIDKAIPFLLTIHDLSFLHSEEFYSLKRRLWHRFINIQKLVAQADKIITVSHNTKRDIMRFFTIAEDKIQVLYPGVEINKMTESNAQRALAKFQLYNPYFLYVGTIEPRKNVGAIIKAFDKLHQQYPNIDLVIAGKKGWVFRHLLHKIKKRPYIHYLGYISGKEKDALYYLSQGLIWPSYYEGFGFPPLEATVHGAPVITSFKTSLPEIMKQQALYVDPYNTADIYQTLKLLLKDDKTKKYLKNKSQNFQIPDWPSQSKKILELFNTMTKKS